MVSERVPRLDDRGWSLAELLVVIAVIAILSAVAIPLFITYLQSSNVRGGAQEMRTAMNRAKQLAITLRQPICVQPVGNGYQFRQNTCVPLGANILTNPINVALRAGADATDTFRLANNVQVTVSPGNVAPVFTPLGGAAPAGQLRVTGPTGAFLTVTVSGGGRVTTP
ncbi:MAG: GspH/FimT family pseudopilin [Candidatus Rokuibacteriota bacterium]